MKVISSKPRGQRMFKSRTIVTKSRRIRKRPFWIEPIDRNIWFDASKIEWIKDPETISGLHSAYYGMEYKGLTDAYSLKAVLRLVRKWKADKGMKFKVSLPYVGYEFIVTKG